MVDDTDTPGSSRASSKAPSTSSSSADKVTKGDFSPRTIRLATYSKAKVRELVATANAFPSDKDVFLWGAIQDAAKSEPSFKDTLNRASQNLEIKEDLLIYVRAHIN